MILQLAITDRCEGSYMSYMVSKFVSLCDLLSVVFVRRNLMFVPRGTHFSRVTMEYVRNPFSRHTKSNVGTT